MKQIHSVQMAFRCQQTIKDALEQFAMANDMHVSQVIRRACSQLLGITERPTGWIVARR